MDNSNKSILITGCSSGIGYVTAKILKEKGFQVIATARSAKDVEKLEKDGFIAFQLDLSSSYSIQQAVDKIFTVTNGKIDVLFNNGAYGQPGAVEDLSREVLKAQFETNFFGTHELTNLIIPSMRAKGSGLIIYNSSVLGFVAMKYRGAYNASKFALEGLADTLRLELRGTNIHISIIEPGPILTDFRKNAFSMYQKSIQPLDKSFHKFAYLAMEARLQQEGAAVAFTLPAEAVAEKVLHAITAKKPKLRYYVTFPTYLFGILKRILPSAWLDYLLAKV